MHKIYCYVDETGQDTLGRMFIVVAIVVDEERDQVLHILEDAEKKSGKTRRKWIKSRTAERNKYLSLAIDKSDLKGKIYYRIFHNTKEYEDLMVLVIAQAINVYVEATKLEAYKATIVIDGLNKIATKRVAKLLRQLGIKIHKIRGEKDDNNALLRLSDAMAGCIREATEGEGDYSNLIRRLAKKEVVKAL